jgi:hypothetical protein
LVEVFEERWLEAQISKILKSGAAAENTQVRTDRDILEEMLVLLRVMRIRTDQFGALEDGFFVPRRNVPTLGLSNFQPLARTPLPLAASTHEVPQSIIEDIADAIGAGEASKDKPEPKE